MGEEAPIAPGRQTAAVVRQLFATAEERVLVTTYSVDWIKVAHPEHHPFAVLAARMDALPDLKVRLAINVARHRDDDRPAETLVKEFVQRFPTHVWPGARLPQLYFHPEGPQPRDREERACLHAKCVVVDGKTALVTSANFSDAAHERNVELGVRIDDTALATSIEDEIDRLIAGGVLAPLG